MTAPLTLAPPARLALSVSASVDQLALLARDGKVNLVASARDGMPTTIGIYPLGDAVQPALVASYTPPQDFPPEWSAVFNAGGNLSVGLTDPGSSISPLVHWRSGDASTTPISRPPRDRIFHSPRFVRRARGALSVVAIESSDWGEGIILFTASRDGTWIERTLREPDRGFVHGALLAAVTGGYLLFYKTPIDARVDPAIRVRPRYPSGDLVLGQLHVVRLDDSFAATGPAIALSDQLYEFDADVEGDRIVMLATTPSGYFAIEARIAAPGVVLTARADRVLPAEVSAPAVLLMADTIHFAVITDAGRPTAAILYGAR